MEIFLLIVFLVIITLYLRGKLNTLSDQNNQLVKKADALEYELYYIKALLSRRPSSEQAQSPIAEPPVEVAPMPVVEEEPLAEEILEEAPQEEESPSFVPEAHWQETFDTAEETVDPQQEEPVFEAHEPVRKHTDPTPSFFDNLDWEKFIGENLINKIGIGILVLGIGFFVKYAIDKEWINEIGRVFIGILCGGALVGIAHRLRKEYKAFSSVLIGGGLSVFYFSVAIAFHEYQLIGQTAAFVIMVLITAFAIQLSVAYNRQELAVLAIIGGFTTPFLVSTGEGNYVVLFTYLLILNTGMLVLAYFKKWNIVNIVSYVFTLILYTGWLSTRVLGKPDAPYLGALVFATLFYLEFFLMNIIHNIKEKRPFIALEFSILLSNTFAYYSAGMLVLEQIQGGVYKGIFTVLLAAFNLVFAFSLMRSGKADKNIVYLLIGLVVTFISLAAPVQLEGNWITMFWALEGVLLLWLAKKSGIGLMKLSAVLVTVLMLISLIMDWYQLYDPQDTMRVLPVLINKAFITSLISLASLYITRRLLKTAPEDFFTELIPVSIYRTILAALLLAGTYVSLLLELNYQLHIFIDVAQIRHIYLGIYHFSWLIGIAFVLRPKKALVSEYLLPALCALSAVIYSAYYHGLFVSVRNLYLTHETVNLIPFLSHYLILLMLICILTITVKEIARSVGYKSLFGTISLWIMAVIILFLASSELDHLVVLSLLGETTTIAELIRDSRRIGYPIIWGLCSFAFMLWGIRKKVQPLRIISLSIFAIILLKLFLIDVSSMPEGGKILSFIILGLLLLTISFLYQRLKRLVTEDEAPADGQVQTPLT